MDTMTTSAKPKRKMLGAVLVLGLLALVIVIDARRRSAEEQLAQLTMRMEQLTGGNTEENRELAKAVVEKLKKHYKVDEKIEPTVATIVDIEALRKQNSAFYGVAQNGDHLIIYPDIAFLYRESEDVIVNMAPVQLTQPPAQQEGQPASQPAN